MARTNPTRIPGRWREGYALDYHTVSSVFLGYDEFGHGKFDTTRTEVGELLYRLKYSNDKTAVADLVGTSAGFARSWKPGVDLLIPTPPSRRRAEQPLLLVAGPLAEALGIAFAPEYVTKAKEIPELKDVHDFDQRTKLLEGAFKVDKVKTAGKRVLLFDDLFRSGATLNALGALLYDEGEAADVCALTLTRTRSNR